MYKTKTEYGYILGNKILLLILWKPDTKGYWNWKYWLRGRVEYTYLYFQASCDSIFQERSMFIMVICRVHTSYNCYVPVTNPKYELFKVFTTISMTSVIYCFFGQLQLCTIHISSIHCQIHDSVCMFALQETEKKLNP